VRERLGVVHDPRRARAIAADAIRSAAQAKNNPPDLINVALEMLVKASLELPGFSTLDVMAGRIRRQVNMAMFERIAGRIGLPDRVGLESLLEVGGSSAKTPFNRLKQAAGKASCRGFASRSSTWGGSTRSATARRGWRASRSRRSPISPVRRWLPTPR
ncbi:MAG: DUF4158 domain-containing protein, partial [Actinobacteria bacterium]|nr:DUF4158 domain-containing protein [Actinomycetota bacterium]